MWCAKCGTKIDDNSNFCLNCGEPIVQSSDDVSSSQTVLDENETNFDKNNEKGKEPVSLWKIAVVTIVFIIFLVIISFAISFSSDEKTPDLTTQSTTSEVFLPDISNYKFIEGNYYLCQPDTPSSDRILVKFSKLSSSRIEVDCYYLFYGEKNHYYHYVYPEDVSYNENENCYEFDAEGYWRIYKDKLYYSRYDDDSPTFGRDYNLVTPVALEDVWWYEEAKISLGDYSLDYNVSISDAKVGDEIIFGKYEMDANTNNGPEDIPWIVLDETEDSLLLLSKYCLTYRTLIYKYVYMWEHCDCRSWLNGTFYDDTFSADEKTKIKKTTVSNTYYESQIGDDLCEELPTTDDFIFLLSQEEFYNYFSDSPNEDNKICYGTLSAIDLSDGKYNDRMIWALRDTCDFRNDIDYSSGNEYGWSKNYYVNKKGNICNDEYARYDVESPTYPSFGIRPVMWISKK